MAKYPTRRQLLLKDYQEHRDSEEQLHKEHVELMDAFGKLQETMDNQQASMEEEREAHRREVEEIKKGKGGW